MSKLRQHLMGDFLNLYRDGNKSRVLVQALILSLDRVPRSLVVSCGTLIGGMGCSWSIPVYILNGHFPDAFPANEDPMPFDGVPHPEHASIVMGPNPQDPNWQLEHQGANPELGHFGGNPHLEPVDHLVNLYANQNVGVNAGMNAAVNEAAVADNVLEMEEADDEMESEISEGCHQTKLLGPMVLMACF